MSYPNVERGSSYGTSTSRDFESNSSKIVYEQPSVEADDMRTNLDLSLFSTEETKAALYNDGEEAQFSCLTLRSVVSGISKALSGQAVVTAPVLHKNFDWLGRISVKSGKLEGPYYRKHRTYCVHGQILAAGHVLPWQIGRSWRYSDMYALLVEELEQLVETFDLRPHYSELISTFPPKTWQGRNSNQISEYRARAIERYVMKGIEITSALLDSIPVENRLTKKQRERELKRKRQIQRQRQLQRELGGGQDRDNGPSDRDQHSADADGEDDELPKDPEQVENELKQILELFVAKLLGIDGTIMEHLVEISKDLGQLISKTPALQTRVTKEFKVDPQQAL